ncbi:MAG: threonine synthase [Candidatus Bathyarchaeota archaeon]|nr:MAG: threonine synthase [Candidatus Bathyarchaeota archaeon]
MAKQVLVCSSCGEVHQSTTSPASICPKCRGVLLFKYDLSPVANTLSREILATRSPSFWKFIEVLPLTSSKNIVSLGEPFTPLLQFTLGRGRYSNLWLKDDGRLPTGTFKARGMAVAVSTLKELGVSQVAVPSAGNAAAALTAYGARAGMQVFVFMPNDTPPRIIDECVHMGAKVHLVDGSISAAGQAMKKYGADHNWFDVSTNKQPYRYEGYKVAAYEIAEQFSWNPPDHILFPTGGGEGVIGLWKGFQELCELGWTKHIPRLTIVQSSGCAPLVTAFYENQREVEEPWKNPNTIAVGLKVPHPYGSYLVLRAVRETKGTAIQVADEEILSSMKTLWTNGIYVCPEAASTLAALEQALTENIIANDEKILLYLTGTALKYPDPFKG